MLKFRIDKQLNLVLCRPNANFSFEELHQHLLQVLEDPDFKPGMHGLYDFTQVDELTGDFSEFMKTADDATDNEAIEQRTPIAIILNRDDDHMIKLFEAYIMMATRSLLNYRIFFKDRYNEALKFIRLSSMPEF